MHPKSRENFTLVFSRSNFVTTIIRFILKLENTLVSCTLNALPSPLIAILDCMNTSWHSNIGSKLIVIELQWPGRTKEG